MNNLNDNSFGTFSGLFLPCNGRLKQYAAPENLSDYTVDDIYECLKDPAFSEQPGNPQRIAILDDFIDNSGLTGKRIKEIIALCLEMYTYDLNDTVIISRFGYDQTDFNNNASRLDRLISSVLVDLMFNQKPNFTPEKSALNVNHTAKEGVGGSGKVSYIAHRHYILILSFIDERSIKGDQD